VTDYAKKSSNKTSPGGKDQKSKTADTKPTSGNSTSGSPAD
jgi:hypothetical protein